MDVTRKNFQNLMPEISKSISEADFISIDGEFTGISHEWTNEHCFDTPESRYHKVLQGSMDFLLMQFGMCLFNYDKQSERYVAKPFNFYVFPRPASRQAPDLRFACQSSSIDFMINQGFDFNKLFKEGIPYLSPHEEQKMREALEFKHSTAMEHLMGSPAFTSPNTSIARSPIMVPDEQKEYIDAAMEKIESFIAHEKETSLNLGPSSGVQRKYTYLAARSKFPLGVHLETLTRENKTREIVVTKASGEDDLKSRELERQNAEKKVLDEEVGFTRVVEIISKSGKPVVGHNMMLDVMHSIHQFRNPLPADYDEFKQLCTCVFPKLIDTKVMGATHPFKEQILSTVLGDMRRHLEHKPFRKPDIEVPDGFRPYNSSAEKLHEAGYDAYVTGQCFISMSNYLGKFQDPPVSYISPSSKLIEPFVNKLFMHRVYDIPYMDLCGPDLNPCRDHIFHVSFPPTWKTADLYQLFSPFGFIRIAWLDRYSAFVGLDLKDNASDVKRKFGKTRNEHYTVTPFKDFMSKQKVNPRKRARPAVPVSSPQRPSASLNVNVSPFVPRRSLETIPEENSGKKSYAAAACAILEDTGEPAGKKSKKENQDEEEKMFEEPSDW